MKSLNEATDEELGAEVQRRKDAAKAARIQEHLDHVERVHENVEALLKVAKHSRTSCSDSQVLNSDRGCVRCALLQLRDTEGYFPFTLTLDISNFDD